MSKSKKKDIVIDNNNGDYLGIITTVNLVVIGLLLIFLGDNIKIILNNIETLNEFQITGLLLFTLGLVSYCFYILKHLEDKEYKLIKILLIISIFTLLSQIIMFLIGSDMINPMQYQWYSLSLGLLSFIIIFVIFALLEYFFVIVILNVFRKTFNYFKQSPERVSVILGFFGTIIVFLIKILN